MSLFDVMERLYRGGKYLNSKFYDPNSDNAVENSFV